LIMSAVDSLPDLPRLLILDADDSYTRNILDLILGACPSTNPAQLQARVLILRANRLDWSTLSTQIIPHFAAVILGPGPGRPSSAANPRATLEHPASIFTRIFSPLPLVGRHHVPTFGLCLGHQALGFAYGAAVHPAPKVLHGQLSNLQLQLDPAGRPLGVLDRLKQGTSVVRYNSLTVDPSSISEQVQITAWAQDGPTSRTVMGLAHKTLPFHSVQFHPESVCSTDGTQILRSFLQVVSDSSYVNSDDGIGRATAYSDLPEHIVELSELRRGAKRDSDSTEPRKKASFQLRSIIFKDSHLSPEQVFQNSIKVSSPLGHVWLDSADSLSAPQPAHRDCHSHMGAVDFLVSYFAARKTLSIREAASKQHGSDQHLDDSTTFWDWLRNVQDELQACTETLPPSEADISVESNKSDHPNGSSTESPPAPPGGAPVGFMGYIGYELLAESLAHYNLPCRSVPDVPDAELGFCNTALSYDHASSTWTATALVVSSPRTEGPSKHDLHHRFPLAVGLSEIQYQEWTRKVQEIFDGPKNQDISPDQAAVPEQQQSSQSQQSTMKNTSRKLESIVSESAYLEAITKAQCQITSGESYELCLTTQFRGQVGASEDEHFGRYMGLRRANPAPHGAYVRFGAYDTTILSSSPERFLRVDGRGEVEMKPIKGTARRVLGDVAADLAAGQALQEDAKERAENLMITDLVRHDLHGFCVPGTVRVARLFGLETVATVHSLVSTVKGALRPALNPVDAIAAAFPPGSMTGAPKLSSIEILDNLESNHPRGPYSGILGFIALDGRADMSVVIRTAVIRNNQISVGAGGAITHLSRKEDEWKEVRLKMDAVQRSLSLS